MAIELLLRAPNERLMAVFERSEMIEFGLEIEIDYLVWLQ